MMRRPSKYQNKLIIIRITKNIVLLLLLLSFCSAVVVVVLSDDDDIISTTATAADTSITSTSSRRLKHQQPKQKEHRQQQIQHQPYDSSYFNSIMNQRHHHYHYDRNHNRQKNIKEVQKMGSSSNNNSSTTNDDSMMKFDYHHHDHQHDDDMEQHIIYDDDCKQENNNYNLNNEYNNHNNSHKIMKNNNDCIHSTKRRNVEKSTSSNHIENTECFHISPSKEMIENDIILMKQWTKQYSSSRLQPPSYYIPVYIHSLISNSDDNNYNVTDNYNDIINYINEKFIKHTNTFTFILQQTTRTINNHYANECFIYVKEYMKLLKRGGSETLNIYFCNIILDNRTNIQYDAFATMPSNNIIINDGIVIARSKTNDNNNEQIYNTLIHEMGHYFGLFHTYSSTCRQNNGGGDFVIDTPQHLNKENQVNCHTDPLTWDTCPDISGIDPVNNYMTYAPDKLCRTSFTPGQVERMIGQFELYRLNPNINIVPTTPPNTQRPLLPSNSIMTPSNNNNNNKPQPPQPPTEQNGSTPSIQIIPTSKSAPSISKPIPINRPNVLLVPVRTPTTLNAPRNANTPIATPNVCSETQSQRQCQQDIDCCSGQQCRHKKWWLILGSKICYDRHQWWIYNWIQHWF